MTEGEAGEDTSALEEAITAYIQSNNLAPGDDMFPVNWIIAVGYQSVEQGELSGVGYIPKDNQPLYVSLGLATYAQGYLQARAAEKGELP